MFPICIGSVSGIWAPSWLSIDLALRRDFLTFAISLHDCDHDYWLASAFSLRDRQHFQSPPTAAGNSAWAPTIRYGMMLQLCGVRSQSARLTCVPVTFLPLFYLEVFLSDDKN